MTGELGLRERKRRKAMREIQEQAARLILERGYAETTIEDIAEAAEVSPSSVYRYFGTKEGVILYDELAPPWQEALAREMADHSPLEAARRSLSDIFSHYFNRDDELPRTLVGLVFEEPSLQAAFVQEMELMVDELASTLGEAGEDPLESRVIARVLIAAFWEAGVQWHRGGFEEDLDAIIERVIAILQTEL